MPKTWEARGRKLLVGAVLAFAAAFPAITPASSPGVGTAESTVSLLSVHTDLNGVSTWVKVMNGSGMATTDPSRNGAYLAQMKLDMVRAGVGDVVEVTGAPFDVSARAEGPADSSEESTDLALTLDFGETLQGALRVASISAGVDATKAAASLSQVDFGTSVKNGLVSLQGVQVVGGSSSADDSSASAAQTVHADSAYMFSLGEFLAAFNKTLADLSDKKVANLGEYLLGSDPVTALNQAIGDLEQILADAGELQIAMGELQDGDTEPADLDALAKITELAGKYGVTPVECSPVPTIPPCDPVAKALETGDLVNLAIIQSTTRANNALGEARSDVENGIEKISLLTLRNVEVSASAGATDSGGTSDAVVSWGAAEVVGQPVDFADLQDAAQKVTAAVVAALNNIGDAVGLNFNAVLSFPSPNKTNGSDGDYRVADSGANAFAMTVGAVSDSGDSMGVGVSLLDMTAAARHKSAVPDQGCTDPNGCEPVPDPGCTDPNGCEPVPDPGCTDPNGCDGNGGGSIGGGLAGGLDDLAVLGDLLRQDDSQGSGGPSGNPSDNAAGSPDLGGSLPKTGAPTDKLLLLALELILLGAALQRKSRPEAIAAER